MLDGDVQLTPPTNTSANIGGAQANDTSNNNNNDVNTSSSDDNEKDTLSSALATTTDTPSSSSSSSSEESYTLSSTISKKRCIFISFLIVLSHALFLWGQLDILWGQFVYTQVQVDASAANEITQSITSNLFNGTTSADIDKNNSIEIGSWSYGGMLSELWIYSKLTAVFLFVFSAFWPHLKLFLLHIYFYIPVPSKPRRSAIYWLDSVGKMSLADVCATCMLFLLLNVSADINIGNLTNAATQLMTEMVDSVSVESLLSGDDTSLSNIFENTVGSWTFDEIVDLGNNIFEDNDAAVYKTFLEKGCSTHYNDGETCVGTPFYEPTQIKGGIPGIMAKCLRIRNDNCYQCECIVNNVLYNHDIPDGVVQSKMEDTMSFLFAELLKTIQSGDLNFGSWFDVGGTISLGMYITIYPAFLGFTFAVIFSIIASLVVGHVDEKDALTKYHKSSSIVESLENNSEVDMDQRSFLYNGDGSCSSKMTRLLSIVVGLGIIPLTFFAVYVKMFNYSIAGFFEELIMLQPEATDTLFSVIDCVTTVNDGTGYGKTFAVFYGLFLLGIPMMRATLLAIMFLIPMSPMWHVRLGKIANEIGGFIGWEPFFLCVLIVSAELPTLTKDMVNPETCGAIEEKSFVSFLIDSFGLDQTSTCFVMYFKILPAFALFILAWMFLTGANAMVWKKILLRYDPFGTHKHGDDGGPYFNCRQCCYFGCPKKSKEVDPGSDKGCSKTDKKYKLEYRDGQEEQFTQEE